MKKVITMAIFAMLMFVVSGGVATAKEMEIKVGIVSSMDEIDAEYNRTKGDPEARQRFLRGRAKVCFMLSVQKANEICRPSWKEGTSEDRKCFMRAVESTMSERGCNYPELKR